MRRLALARLRRTPGRYVACALAVGLAVAFAVLVQLTGSALAQLVRDRDVASVGGADVVVRVQVDDLPPAVVADGVETVAGLPGVASVHRDGAVVLEAELPRAAGTRFVTLGATPPPGDLRWPTLLEGRWPEAPGEAVVGDQARVGEQLVVLGDLASLVDGTTGPRTTLDVVGRVDVGLASDYPVDPVLVQPAEAVELGAGRGDLLVAAAPGTGTEELLATVAGAVAAPDAAPSDGTTDVAPLGAVITADQLRAERESDSATLRLLLRTALGAFALVAVVVAVVVVSNTYAVLLAQQVREQALLRCVGATRRDLWRAGTTEALVLGAAAGAVGALVGWGLAWAGAAAVTRWSPVTVAAPVPSPLEVLGAVVLGGAAAVVASVAALARAGAVSPLAALRPVEAVPESARASVLRVVIGVLLVVGGGAGTVAGAVLGEVPLALPAAVLAFLGVLVLGRLLLPRVAGGLGRLVALVGGPTGSLAAASAGRHPRRTAATASAVVIGVTLAVTAAVGAASLRATGEAEVAGYLPVDATVTSDRLDEPGVAALARAVAGVEGVDAAGPARSVAVAVQPDRPDGSVAGAVDVHVTTAFAGDLTGVLPAADVPPGAGTVVLSAGQARRLAVATGHTVSVASEVDVTDLSGGTGGSAGRSLVVVVDEDTPVDVQLDPATADELGASGAVLLTLAEAMGSDDVEAVVDAVSGLAYDADPDAAVDSPALLLQSLRQTLDVLLAVVGGMLAVTVAIALVGVSTTLSLSLVERRQENALLRALGLSRSRLRTMVAWEALVLGLVGAAVGTALGVGFGVAGTYALIGDPEQTVVRVPWLQLLGLVALIGSVAVAASLWPAHRASRLAPAGALGAPA